MGGSDDCDLQLFGKDICPRHCLIEKKGNAWKITNLSRNGIFLSTRKIEKRILNHGDQLQLGQYEVIYEDFRHKSEMESTEDETGTYFSLMRKNAPLMEEKSDWNAIGEVTEFESWSDMSPEKEVMSPPDSEEILVEPEELLSGPRSIKSRIYVEKYRSMMTHERTAVTAKTYSPVKLKFEAQKGFSFWSIGIFSALTALISAMAIYTFVRTLNPLQSTAQPMKNLAFHAYNNFSTPSYESKNLSQATQKPQSKRQKTNQNIQN